MANFCACPPENSIPPSSKFLYIAVFQKGKLIQYGTHDELVKDKGNEYETMYSAQAQYYI